MWCCLQASQAPAFSKSFLRIDHPWGFPINVRHNSLHNIPNTYPTTSQPSGQPLAGATMVLVFASCSLLPQHSQPFPNAQTTYHGSFQCLSDVFPKVSVFLSTLLGSPGVCALFVFQGIVIIFWMQMKGPLEGNNHLGCSLAPNTWISH